MHHLVPNLRYIGCLVYWDPQENALSWEDRDRLIEMDRRDSDAFARLLDRGCSLTDITPADMAGEVRRATAPAGKGVGR